MPAHDWTRVTAGTFHHFHSLWIGRLSDALNAGLLPDGLFALVEQHTGDAIPDVLTLSTGARNHVGPVPADGGGTAVADAPPKVAFRMTASESAGYREARRTLVIRHRSRRQIVAMLEIVSPANKDREKSVQRFVQKAYSAVRQGIHLLVIDLFPPGPFDPQGMHGAIWEDVGGGSYVPMSGKPLTLAAYLSGDLPEAFVEPPAVGDALPDMPLFLDLDRYVNAPLESTCMAAYAGVPAFLRDIVEGGAPAETE